MTKQKRIIRLIKKIWKKYPTFRLTQLLGNCFKPGDLYYKSDDELEKELKNHYNTRR